MGFILANEVRFLRRKGGLLTACSDCGVEVIERVAQRTREHILGGQQRLPGRAQDPQILFAVEERHLEPVGRNRVAVGALEAVDESLQPEAPEVIRHLGGGIWPPEQGFNLGTQVAVVEAAREIREAGDRLAEGHDAGIAEAERRGALPGFDRGMLQAVEGVLGQHTVVADAFDLQEPLMAAAIVT